MIRKEVLVYVGLDTVSLNGGGFQVMGKLGAKANAVDSMVRIDRTLMEEKGIKMTTMIIFTDEF